MNKIFQNNQLRVGVIGAGAVAEFGHLPSLQDNDLLLHDSNNKSRSVSQITNIIVLVDTNNSRLQYLSEKNEIKKIANDYSEIFQDVDAVIISLPHHLHAPVSIDFLNRGVHVLIEKPMATSLIDCKKMIKAAKNNNSILAVGLMRRFLYGNRFVKSVIDNGVLGDLKYFEFNEGDDYDWPVTSDSFFNKEKAGGGVLIDTGAHTLDSLLWWLGEYENVEYYDDNKGGVESECKLFVKLKNGSEGKVQLSRLRNLNNKATIYGQKGELTVHLRNSNCSLRLYEWGKNNKDSLSITNTLEWIDLMKLQVKDWVEAIINNKKPTVDGVAGFSAIELIEKCYNNRKPLDPLW